MEAAAEFVHLSHEVHYAMQTMIEVGLIMFAFMTVIFIVYLVLGKI